MKKTPRAKTKTSKTTRAGAVRATDSVARTRAAVTKTSLARAKSVANGSARLDWRAETLARVRALIEQAVPGVVEEIKWRKPSNPAGVPVWSSPAPAAGIICTGETYKAYVKLTFPKGASLADPSGLFNAGLQGGTRRAIDLSEGARLNERAFKALVRAAAAANA